MRLSTAATVERLLPESVFRRARPLLERVDRTLFSHDDRGQAGRMSLIAFLVRVCSAIIAFASQVLLARWMGSFEYGIFVLVWTTMIILGNISCLGFHSSVVRFIPEYRERGELERLRGVFAASQLVVLVASTLIALAGIAGVWLLSDAFESYYAIPFYLGLICLPLIALGDLAYGIGRANSWALLALLPIYILRPLLILAFMGGALFAGYEASAQTAIVATILATLSTTLMQYAATLARTRRQVPPGLRSYHLRDWMVISLPILLVEGFFYVMTNADVLMVGYFLSPNEVAVYFATVKTLALVHFVYFAVKAGAAQRYSQYAHSGDHVRLAAFARETVSWTFWPSLAMGAVVLVLGQPMLRLFGEGFEAGYPLLYPLVAGVVLRAAVGPAESLLTMTGHHNICALVYGGVLAVNISLTIVLIPLFGLWGAASATAFAFLVEAALLSLVIWRKLGIVMFVFAPRATAAGAT